MADLTVVQMTEYLKQVAALESSVYKQQTVRRNAIDALRMPNVKKRTVTKPDIEERFWGGRPLRPSFLETVGDEIIPMCLLPVILVPLGLMCLLGLDAATLGYLSFVAAAVVIVLAIKKLLCGIPQYIKKQKLYPEELEKYDRSKEEHQKKYKAAMATYQQNQADAEKEYLEAKETARINYLKASENVKQLDAPLQQTQELLDEIYKKDIIFPKYRNMIAMCTIYEYFAAGRCTDLTGPTGAYNLYEAELRQNLIINQLENVNANLEQVKQNQYILYQGIAETNHALREISADVKNMVSATYDIAVSSRITAYCSQVTAANAQAQTYLAIMD